ncbi:hypothetical protein J437_LFUL004533 [Ladona fulva]|uniref:Serum response factor homolog n=1 Tax=Ladona fulva TaxID=123851 RepID=A0A8K0KAI0_LADFU|nr:hypothetical protein J437_LFUL004533 [Ladona fulva]
MSYNMSLLSGGETSPEMYGHGNSGNSRPSTSLGVTGVTRSGISAPVSCGGPGGVQRSLKRTSSDAEFDQNVVSAQQQSGMGLVGECGVGASDIADDAFSQSHQKKTPPPNGKKTKGRVKIKMEYIDNKLRRYTTFSKRKTGIMKKAYELSTLTGTQVMLLVASETGHVYTFATRKLQPMITSEAGKALIQTCLNSPDPPPSAAHHPDQRMSATGFEETELTYNIAEEEQKVRQMVYAAAAAAQQQQQMHHQHQVHQVHQHQQHVHLQQQQQQGMPSQLQHHSPHLHHQHQPQHQQLHQYPPPSPPQTLHPLHGPPHHHGMGTVTCPSPGPPTIVPGYPPSPHCASPLPLSSPQGPQHPSYHQVHSHVPTHAQQR